MNRIEKDFHKQQELNPLSSSLINFSKAMKGKKLSRENLEKLFTKLVDKEDYNRGQKQELLDWYMLR